MFLFGCRSSSSWSCRRVSWSPRITATMSDVISLTFWPPLFDLLALAMSSSYAVGVTCTCWTTPGTPASHWSTVSSGCTTSDVASTLPWCRVMTSPWRHDDVTSWQPPGDCHVACILFTSATTYRAVPVSSRCFAFSASFHVCIYKCG